MKKTLSLLLSLILVLCVTQACAAPEPSEAVVIQKTAAPVPSPVPEEPVTIALSYPVGTEVDIVTPLQREYLEDSVERIRYHVVGMAENSKPEAVRMRFRTSESGTSKVLLSEDESFSDPMIRVTDGSSCEFTNLKSGTKYYWKVVLGKWESPVASFTTEAGVPRFISLEGVTNARYIGGFPGLNGKTVKQGMLYRTGKLDHIREQDVPVALNELGLRSEIDLRYPYDTNDAAESFIDPSVRYFSCPMVHNSGDFFTEDIEGILSYFEIISDESNYPLAVHCAIGTDRTGMVCFLTEALLGMNEETVCRDYLLSNFGFIGGSRTMMTLASNPYYVYINEQEGATFQQKTYNLLLSIGVPAEQLDSVIDIMLEK